MPHSDQRLHRAHLTRSDPVSYPESYLLHQPLLLKELLISACGFVAWSSPEHSSTLPILLHLHSRGLGGRKVVELLQAIQQAAEAEIMVKACTTNSWSSTTCVTCASTPLQLAALSQHDVSCKGYSENEGWVEVRCKCAKGPCSSARFCGEGKASSAAVFSCSSPRAPSLPLPANHSLLLMCPPISAPNEGSTSSKSSLVLTLLLCAEFWALYKKYHLLMKNWIKKGCKRLAWETLKLPFSSLCTQFCNYKNALFIHACLFCSCFWGNAFSSVWACFIFPSSKQMQMSPPGDNRSTGLPGLWPSFSTERSSHSFLTFFPVCQVSRSCSKPQEPRLYSKIP